MRRVILKQKQEHCEGSTRHAFRSLELLSPVSARAYLEILKSSGEVFAVYSAHDFENGPIPCVGLSATFRMYNANGPVEIRLRPSWAFVND